MNAARLNGATLDVEADIAVGEADEAAVVDVVALRARAAGDRIGLKHPTSRTVVRK